MSRDFWDTTLADLGVRASDLLQANSVIWVEGPSDRIYIKKWLSLIAPELREGIDFAIMFYGGKCLSHVSASRDDIPGAEDLIPLLRINQHSMIVIDSDRDGEAAELNATKNRVEEECQRSEIPCWITDGREIEKYLPIESICQAYAEITGGEAVTCSYETFDLLEDALKCAYGSAWKQSWSYDAHKPGRARIIAKHVQRKHISGELTERLQEFVNAIQKGL